MMQGQVLFKEGGDWHFSYLIFSRFIILHLETILPFAKLCYAFEEKNFFCHYNFMKEVIRSYLVI